MGYLDNAGLSYFWGKIKNIFAYKSDIPAASTNTPAVLGTAAAGSSTAWARGDHVHAMPSASDVGAISTAHIVNSITSADISSWNNKLDDENIYIIHTEWDASLNKTVVSEPWEDVVAAGEAGKLIYLKDVNVDPILVTYWPETEDDGEVYPPELTWATTGYGGGTYEVTTIMDFFWYTDEGKLQQNQTMQIAATPSAIPSASSATPAALGTPAVGSSSAYARADHVHAMPSASDVGAIAAPSSASTGAFLTYNGSAWVATTLSAWQGGSY